MGLKLSERSHVADTATGRRHGRIKKTVRAAQDGSTPIYAQLVHGPVLVGFVPPCEARFLVEWRDGGKSEHDDAELIARFTSQSKDYGKVF